MDKIKLDFSKKPTGGSNPDYYGVYVAHPVALPDPYKAECLDIIEALNMDFAEGEAFKSIWRRATERLGRGKLGQEDTQLYNAQKVAFYGQRMVATSKPKQG